MARRDKRFATATLSDLPHDVMRNVFNVLLRDNDRTAALHLALTSKANLALFRALQATLHVPDSFSEALRAITQVRSVYSSLLPGTPYRTTAAACAATCPAMLCLDNSFAGRPFDLTGSMLSLPFSESLYVYLPLYRSLSRLGRPCPLVCNNFSCPFPGLSSRLPPRESLGENTGAKHYHKPPCPVHLELV
jgi:hypothetical protein